MGGFISLQEKLFRIQGTMDSYHISVNSGGLLLERVQSAEIPSNATIDPTLASLHSISMEETVVAVNPLRLTMIANWNWSGINILK